MPRLRRKTPHEPVRAIPAPVERGAAALPPRSIATEPRSLRELVIALNGGKARDRTFDADLPMPDALAAPTIPPPLRDRVQRAEGRAELLVFRIGPELFAMELRAVEEAVEGVEVRMIPDAPPSMLGIFALRDRSLPMYMLSRVLGLADATATMTLVMRPTDTRIALAVDAVDDVFDAALDAVRPTPTADADGLVLGVVWRADELITFLDADAVVSTCLASASPPDSL